MHDDRSLVEARLDRALRERIRPAVYAAATPFELTAWHVPGEPVPVADALAAEYVPFRVGERWGAPWATTWFRVSGTVPEEWAGRRVEAVFDLGFVGDWPGGQAEALVYDADGHPLKGVAPRNQYVPIANPAAGGEQVNLLVEAAANPDILANGFIPTPMSDRTTAPDEPIYRFARAELAVLDETVWHLVLDIEVLNELMRELPTTEPRRHEILRALESMLDTLDLLDVAGTAAAARAELADVLAKPAHASAHTISAVGHAHIDSAWLWPVRETVRKTSRTFANVTSLAADYPEFLFACSQAQHYAWVKDCYPEIYERIQSSIKSGQWIPVGSMWVEPDGNLPGGEALARQLILGKRFFLEEFGVETHGVWLPDSFGYTAAFPQLARLAGAQWFLTQKLSWNQTNRLPHHTFWWEGIDGSQVFTHFPPVDSYVAAFEGAELALAVRNYAEKGRGTRSLAPFGYGDGGGGPTREMLEKARRLANLEGSPKVVIEPPDEFFRAAEAEYPDAPVWSGEMYLELHRGTFTTQARGKAGNRRSEHLLREAELWAATASVHGDFEYPYEDLDRIWKAVLLHQFHDILPGTSIGWVHRETEAIYAETIAELEAIIAAAVGSLVGDGEAPLVLNTSPRDRAEVVELSDGGTAYALAPASGVGRLTSDVPQPVSATETVLDNGLVRVELDADGLFTSVRDLANGRELLAPGERGNLLRLHDDLPNEWDAWDVDAHYKHRFTELTHADSVTVVSPSPLLGAVRIERSHGESRITQTVRLRAGSRRVDIETEVDWHETEKFLKAVFPLDVHAERTAAEIQFGHVQRPTHTNTSWEAARFEVYAHRWIHVAEPGYGVALLTDSTYGYDAGRTSRPGGGTTTTVGLSLLRAPRCPDPLADQGAHKFTYSLLAGADVADTVTEGYALNLPLRVVNAAADPVAAPLVTLDGSEAAIIEAVKLADDRSGDVIVRVYESLGGRADAVVRPGFEIASAEIVDLLERPLSPAVIEVSEGGSIPVSLRPFQILTLRLTPVRSS
ncbi:MAG TPA: glycoside hydrolase family 38 C-terminal domain-containing protein [Actinospica sp.]|jgi:alpha-mannosidase|nr:glycoside hydrolase family 38 C-terminal domain-containing protein [Actinospica sp.]